MKHRILAQSAATLLLGDIALVAWLSLPTMLLVELLQPGFVSDLFDITGLAIAAIFVGIVHLLTHAPVPTSRSWTVQGFTQGTTNELVPFQYWYAGVWIVFDILLLLVLLALQPRHLLLVLVVLVATIMISISIFFLYDRRRYN